MDYFDANMNSQPIQDIDVLANNADCGCTGTDCDHDAADGWEQVPTLNTWRGTAKGCSYHERAYLGSCK